jgi:hypothetical protein
MRALPSSSSGVGISNIEAAWSSSRSDIGQVSREASASRCSSLLRCSSGESSKYWNFPLVLREPKRIVLDFQTPCGCCLAGAR